ncbi:extracellular solute-binding protein [candidate division GN15 bacterium]|nr:extracellular solute-binding protein [candidate division GN15 bacterium]
MRRTLVGLIALCMVGSLAFAAGTGEQAAEEQMTLRILAHPWNFDPMDDPLLPVMEEVGGYDLEYVMVPQGDAGRQKFLLEIASGNRWDILYTYQDVLQQLARQGGLVDLTDLIEEHGPNIITAYDADPRYIGTTTIDGRIYGIPIIRNTEVVNQGIIYRKDLMDQAGFEEPETLIEFTQALQTVQDQTDMIPLTGQGFNYHPIRASFNLTGWQVLDGEVTPDLFMPRFEDWLEYMTTLYEAGLIDAEAPSNTRDIKREKFISGRAFFMDMQWWDWQMLQAVRDNMPEAEWDYIVGLEDERGEWAVTKGTGISRVVAVPRTAASPEDSIKFLNAHASVEGFRKVFIGDEGVHWEWDGNRRTPIIENSTVERRNAWWYVIQTPIEEMVELQNLAIESEHPDTWEVFLAFQDGRPRGRYNPLDFLTTGPVQTEYARTLNQLQNDFTTRVITGQEDLSALADFREEWLDAGGREMLEEIQENYEASQN